MRSVTARGSSRYRPVMSRTATVLPLVVLSLGALGACAILPEEPTAGVGLLQVSDLERPTQEGHFTGAPVPMTARIDVTSTGCVFVVVDDVERYPFWPEGTSVDQLPERRDDYVVSLPGGTTLSTGESFEAIGLVDDSTEPFLRDSLPAMLLDYCAIEGAPVAFFDASTIVPLSG